MKHVNKLTDVQAAYIAGLYDGEGSLYGKTLKITQAEHGVQVLHLVKDWIGVGGVSVHRPATDKWQTCYRYTIQSKRYINELFEQILPYLVVKKEKALHFE